MGKPYTDLAEAYQRKQNQELITAELKEIAECKGHQWDIGWYWETAREGSDLYLRVQKICNSCPATQYLKKAICVNKIMNPIVKEQYTNPIALKAWNNQLIDSEWTEIIANMVGDDWEAEHSVQAEMERSNKAFKEKIAQEIWAKQGEK